MEKEFGYNKDGSYYEGQIINRKKEGKGIKYYNDGSKYDGEWKNDKREGNGIYIIFFLIKS